MTEARRKRALDLFGVSVLKQSKLRQIVDILGETEGKACLDVGSDNGVISMLLRDRGGTWSSADLDQATVAAIRDLVGENVYRIDGLHTPFADGVFDRVVIVDFLEHIHTDREFVTELSRILKPAGELIVNVPHLRPRSVLNRVRHAIGQTDERHGHVRPGYSLASLRQTLEPEFEITAARTYSRSFSEVLDTLLRFGVDRVQTDGAAAEAGSDKGSIVTAEDLESRGKSLALLKLTYPLFWLFSRLDHLLFFQPGYKLIVRAHVCRRPGDGSAQ